MAIGSGLGAQVGFATESTYGTFVTPTRFLEFNSETIALEQQRIESAALRSGNRVLRTDRWANNRKGAAGDIQFDVQTKGFGLPFQWAFMQAPVIDANAIPSGSLTSAKHFTFTPPANPFGANTFFTTQFGIPDVSGTLRAFNYLGCKVASWTLTQELDDFLNLKLSIDARDEDTTVNTTPTAAAYVASPTNFDYSMLAVTIGGSGVPVTKFELDVDNSIDTARYFLNSTTLKSEPIANDFMKVTGSIEMEFTDLTQYARFRDATLAAVTATWTGPSLPGPDSAKNFILKLTLPNVRFDGTSPDVASPDVVPLVLPFTALYDGSAAVVTLELQSSDTAA